MGKQPFISHAVNGYSRYDVPESKAFSCTPGPLYPVRIDFINARDRVTISQGIDVRSNPLAVPSFNPYTVRLHRFWVPMQLYHPEMRTNSSKFDMNDVSLNWICCTGANDSDWFGALVSTYSNSLMNWLRIASSNYRIGGNDFYNEVSLPASAKPTQYVNADSYLAYWDIVRNYYSYPQWGLYSIAWPASWFVQWAPVGQDHFSTQYANEARFFVQRYCDLDYLDAYYESQFYPSSVESSNKTFNRFNLFDTIVRSDITSNTDNPPIYPLPSVSSLNAPVRDAPVSQFSVTGSGETQVLYRFGLVAHPMAVAPSNPDRFSRMLPFGSSSDVSTTGVTTIPQLAIASRLQEYKDLLGAGGSRYSDWLETFFASRIEHVDRPKLLFSASQTVNVQVVMNTAGVNNFGSNGVPLGQQGGSIAFNAQLGRRQSYYFREPGYMIDILSIRPVYYWAGTRPDYLNYTGADYFNPIYNDIGYQDVPSYRLAFNFAANPATPSIAVEPCFNEFRSSYDEVLGQLSWFSGTIATSGVSAPLYAYWVQQRYLAATTATPISAYYVPLLFVDMETVNSPFASTLEDNFFVNMSYSVQKKNLVNKTFATRLSNR